MKSPLLTISDLHIRFRRHGATLHPVRGVSLQIAAGECVALVGESGSGKSLTALSIARLPPTERAIVSGDINLDGLDLSSGDPAALAQARCQRLAYVFQDPAGSLNPVMRVGAQIAETLGGAPLSKSERRQRVVELLERVGLQEPQRQARAYPCEMSGGMQQRVMLAMALAGKPKLLVADEPTTALDVVTQRLVLDLIESVAKREGLAVLLITHNLALAAARAHRIYVLYGGTVVESGAASAVTSAPRHPYTGGLLAAVPRLSDPPRRHLRDIPGVVPGADAWPPGCAFAPRCPRADDRCHAAAPPLETDVHQHQYRCWHPLAAGEPAG